MVKGERTRHFVVVWEFRILGVWTGNHSLNTPILCEKAQGNKRLTLHEEFWKWSLRGRSGT